MSDEKIELGDFEGKDVLRTEIKVTNTGDGLSKAMATKPQVLHHDETVYVVMETMVVDVQHPPIKDTDCVARKHVLKAGTATIVDAALVQEVIRQQAEANQRAAEERDGVQRITDLIDEESEDGEEPDTDDPEAEAQ